MRQTIERAYPPSAAVGLVLAAALAVAGCTASPARPEAVRTSDSIRIAESVDSDVRAEFDAAMKHLNAEDYEKGIELLTRLTARAKTNTAPFINLAIAHRRVGNLEAAEENLKKAIALNPDHPVANNEFGLLYRKTGRFAEARKTYERALEKSPQFLPARKNLAILCDLYLKDLECALNHYELYRRAVPEDKAVEIWIADVQARMGR
jgi:tetratricopeptide (TPR) repeat protein